MAQVQTTFNGTPVSTKDNSESNRERPVTRWWSELSLMLRLIGKAEQRVTRFFHGIGHGALCSDPTLTFSSSETLTFSRKRFFTSTMALSRCFPFGSRSEYLSSCLYKLNVYSLVTDGSLPVILLLELRSWRLSGSLAQDYLWLFGVRQVLEALPYTWYILCPPESKSIWNWRPMPRGHPKGYV